MASLENIRVAILATDGVERVELQEPRQALQDAGASTTLLTVGDRSVELWDDDVDRAGSEKADGLVGDADPSQFDALLVPGGVRNPDAMRQEPEAVAFVRTLGEAGKPIASICHGPWMLIEAGLVDGRRITSFPSLQRDLENAGAQWVDEEVVVDGGIVTSRSPGDLDAFCKQAVELFAKQAAGSRS